MLVLPRLRKVRGAPVLRGPVFAQWLRCGAPGVCSERELRAAPETLRVSGVVLVGLGEVRMGNFARRKP